MIFDKMLEEIILNLQSEKSSQKMGKKHPNKNHTPLRKSLLIQSQENSNFGNKSMSFFFNTVDEDKIRNLI